MVARIACGKSIRGVLSYNENKVLSGEATLILAAAFPRENDRLNFRAKLDRFQKLTAQNLATRTNAVHISLNFSRQDNLDDGLLQRIAFDYMEGIGFGGQPFLVYRHFDASHPHIHIATVNIAEGGNRIETHNIGAIQSEKARKEIELAYGLVRAEDQKREQQYVPRPIDLEKLDYGRSGTKAAVSAIVREIVGSYRFTSLPELNAVLRQFNVDAYAGGEGSQMRERGGLVYRITDSDGFPVGIPVKASSIYTSPTLRNLEQKFSRNREARKPYAQRIRHLVDGAFRASATRSGLEEMLRAQGIRIILRANEQRLTYGATVIDNATRTVFKGSELGKAYSSSALLERLESLTARPEPPVREGSREKDPSRVVDVFHPGKYPAGDEPAILTLIDIAMDHNYMAGSPPAIRKKKKKRIFPE